MLEPLWIAISHTAGGPEPWGWWGNEGVSTARQHWRSSLPRWWQRSSPGPGTHEVHKDGNQDEAADVMVLEDGYLRTRLLLIPLLRQGSASRCRTIALCVMGTWATPGEKPRRKLGHKMQKYEMAAHGWAGGRWDKSHPDSVRTDRSELFSSTFSTIIQLQEAVSTSSVKK